MSATSSPNDSPVSVQPLHNPSQAAHVAVPQAPLGNATNSIPSQVPGMGIKALLAKKMAKSHNPKYISPTDNLMTPCTRKIRQAKEKHFSKTGKSMGSLFGTKEELASAQEEASEEHSEGEVAPVEDRKMDDDENPF